jgi:hypothetical protein
MTGDNTPSTSTSHPSVVSVSDPDYLLIQHIIWSWVNTEVAEFLLFENGKVPLSTG